jgi:hypothetical protein
MNIKNGEHRTLVLDNGFSIHGVRCPGQTEWRFSSLDYSWLGNGFYTLQLFAQKVSWGGKLFNSADELFEFVADKIKKLFKFP